MIECSCEWDCIQVRQTADRPIGYLDHWALMTIADDPELREKLVSAVRISGGTLAISWLHLSEFVNVNDVAHAQNAEELLDQLFPQLFLLEINPLVVQSKEDILRRGEAIVAPHSDSSFLGAFLGHDDNSLDPLSVRNLFVILNCDEMRDHGKKMREEVVGRVNDLRADYDSNDEFRKVVENPGPAEEIVRGTRYLTREIMSLILKNRNRTFASNDAMDLMHTIVPVAYCDHVLLDKHWENVANQAKARLGVQGASFPMATVYSSKNNGVEQFILEMERSI